ncbi:MAG: DNA methyltransferase [Usitatibacteraceae bacterium]
MKKLFYGDNLQILREHIADESVDLIYLDPPFNSKRDYNLLFKTPKGHESDAQITAFEDTWHWGGQAQDEFREIEKCNNTDVAEMMLALRSFLGENDMTAYLTMMANRLLEMHRVLKPTGSLYLHCDPTASHYLKIVLDGVFGKLNYRNEITWKRSTSHGNVGRNYGTLTDSIFFYVKSDAYVWNQQFHTFSEEYVEEKFTGKDPDGRRWQSVSLRNPGDRPNLKYPFVASNGKTYLPHQNGWAVNKERLEQYDRESRLYFPTKEDGQLRVKYYLDERPGTKLQNIWDDIPAINSQAQERLGYPTQKPLALLERIIAASSNEGDVVLDPFCGCGTALDAAQKLKRNWIGIDITHLAVSLIEKRLKDRYPELTKKGSFIIEGVPQDFAGARDLAERDKHQFQLWACSLVNVQPYRGGKKGADQGIDGMGFIEVDRGKTEKVLVSVKGGENVSSPMIRDLVGTVEREKAAVGLFVTLTPPTKPMSTAAASAGHYESPHHGAFPRIQILSIQGLLDGTERPQWPDLSAGGQNFKKAKTAAKNTKQKGLFEE